MRDAIIVIGTSPMARLESGRGEAVHSEINQEAVVGAIMREGRKSGRGTYAAKGRAGGSFSGLQADIARKGLKNRLKRRGPQLHFFLMAGRS